MAADPKAAPLANDLKQLALSLPTNAFPKAFFCALCSELAIDSYKLLCCNKAICTPCQAKLSFPTTCPSCDHSPLEADSCAPNKALRNTMRVWLQKQKKKEEAKAAAQAMAHVPDSTTPATGGPVGADSVDKPVDSIEDAPVAGDTSIESTAAAADAEQGKPRAVSASAPPNEGSAALEAHDPERRASSVSQHATQSVEPSTADAHSIEQDKANDNTNPTGKNPTMNGMQGQMGFGFQGQGNFGGMGFNGMPNMMGNAAWNNMNPMDLNMNSMNGMYNNFGGNMGMAMNDMSAMNMMNYGGGYGNGWNGMGGGYGNFNGFNQMGGYNQSGAYPEMMNQFPKNNFQNQNQNRFPANQGGALPQQNNRAGSQGGSVSGPGGHQNIGSRPGSRSGPAQNVRRSHKTLPKQSLSARRYMKPAADESITQQPDGESPDATADASVDSKPEDGRDTAIQSTEEGKDRDGTAQDSATAADTAGDSEVHADDTTVTENQDQNSRQSNGLSQIQTVDSEDAGMQGYGQSMMSNGIVPNMGFANGMMNQFPNQMQMNAPFSPGMNMGFHQNNSFGPRGGFNAAYGAATVLTGEPQGRGVEGAPTGPRAMREGRPNTGFSSRMNNTRYQPPAPKSVTSTQSVGARSPHRRVRSRSPQRDETLRTKDKSMTRSRSRSQPKDEEKEERRERSRSADHESRREDRGRSVTPQGDGEYERRKDRPHHRSSRDDERPGDYDDRIRDDRGSRGDRTRSASADSKYRSSRREKEKYRSSRSHRDRSKEHRRRHRSRSPAEEAKYDDDVYANGDRESEPGSRRKHKSDKDKYRERSRDRDRERDRRDRKEKEKDYDYERDKDRSRDKDRERRRRRDREAEDDDRDYDDDRHRSSRRSRKDRDRDERDRDDRSRDDRRESDRDVKSTHAADDDVVGKMMQKRAISPPLNAPTGPSANTFSIKGAGRTKSGVMPPPQPPTGPRSFQPPKGPAADRDKEKHRRKSSASSVLSTPATPDEPTSQDHYAAERERNARERNSRDRVDRDQRDVLSKSLHSRIHSASRPSLTSKRSRDDDVEVDEAPRESAKNEVRVPTGPASHRDKRRKSGAGGDNSIANLFTAGLRKNAGKTRRGGVRTEGDVEREMERVERERDRR